MLVQLLHQCFHFSSVWCTEIASACASIKLEPLSPLILLLPKPRSKFYFCSWCIVSRLMSRFLTRFFLRSARLEGMKTMRKIFLVVMLIDHWSVSVRFGETTQRVKGSNSQTGPSDPSNCHEWERRCRPGSDHQVVHSGQHCSISALPICFDFHS